MRSLILAEPAFDDAGNLLPFRGCWATMSLFQERRRRTRLTLLAALAATLAGNAIAEKPAAAQAMRVVALRTADGVDPLGVDDPRPRLSWQLACESRGARQTAYQIGVASSRAQLEAGQFDRWDSGKQNSSQSYGVRYAGPPPATSEQLWWRVRAWNERDEPTPWSEPACWTAGVMRPEDWRAVWIVAPWTSEGLLLRREFTVRPGLKRAVAHVCGLGQFEMFVNGGKAGDGLLAPGWSKYDRTCLYETHDVTQLVREGVNAVGLSLGDGMYHAERRHRFSKFQGSFGPQRAICQIELEYADGARERVVTDPTWRVHPGPVIYNDIFGGEDYDARREQRGWSDAGFDAAGWSDAVELVRPGGVLRGFCSSAPPLGEIESLAPASVKTLDDGTQVVDLGQNASFMPRITVEGPIGSTIRLTHAEILDDAGRINRDTCGGNRGGAWWQYAKRTDEPETWRPSFFYAGCRFLQVDRLPASEGGDLPRLAKIEGLVVHSTAAPLGDFACSNELFNRIRTLIRWAQRSNMVSVLTDCPHREKLGWLEQYHLNGPAIRYEFDVARIFAKGMRDMADSQLESGLVPNIAPEYTVFDGTFRAAAEWGCALIVVPWQQYQFTGDDSLIREHYPAMQKYLAYLAGIARDGVVAEGLGDWYDLGPAERPGFAQLTPPEVTATAFYFYDATLLARFAELLDKPDDAARYRQQAAEIRAAWRKKFAKGDGLFATGSQCSQALALVLELAEPEEREAALARLVEDVRQHGNAMTAGDVGFRYLLQALAQGGRSDVICDMINQDDRPGYGYQLKKGATSLTEAWDANSHSSHNHFMLGHVTEWFYKDLVGIAPDPEQPGFARVIVEPQPVAGVEWALGKYQSIRGPITVRWERTDGEFHLQLHVPANSTAQVRLPVEAAAAGAYEVYEADGPAERQPGVTLVGREKDRATYAVESGEYRFTVRPVENYAPHDN